MFAAARDALGLPEILIAAVLGCSAWLIIRVIAWIIEGFTRNPNREP
jgi:hypothetical protein